LKGTKGTNKVHLLCFLCLFVAGISGCSSQSSTEVFVAHEVLPQPPRVGQVEIRLRLTDASRKPLRGAQIKLEGNMSHAGMSPVFVDAPEVAPGEYRSNMDLSMAGDWVVLVHLTMPGGTKLEREFEIKGVAPA
jgi:YtkA-like protein